MKRLLFALLAATTLLAGTAGAQALDDADIVAIATAANRVDLQAGELAISISKDLAVRRFAMRMITDHTAADRAATHLLARIGLEPRPNPTSRSIEENGSQRIAALRGLRGAEFDAAYVAHEIAFHEEVIATLDELLVPSAKSPELASLLRRVRPNFATHLQHARHLQASLPGR